ncbi:transketolase [Anaerocolumna cellulosilytica]|uniref:Transketolase n=1 Tax=Anaerocolumna cellulosilytica TaxID=433286 RepID=A0A6S6QYL1_9FIRM|nr:transketolase C-terminal domain-containing protein [Anaerocolumna cellulosilytica]MBB5194878.1 transketolase [Anaerocolumna cellulosilytica]BCJ94159.1 transketolase [Anaerocolumna cellulosilytica]
MEITKINAKVWSRIGQRETFGMALLELAKENKNLMALTADVSSSAGLNNFIKSLPEQFIDVGIAEQNMMGIAAGLASEGYDVVTTTFAPFQTMRCFEQIRVNLGYMQNKVCMVGLASGLSLGNLGSTHCCFEDMAIMRAIPNIAVVSPADCGEVVKALEQAVKYDTSVYIRLMGREKTPIVYKDEYEFEIGKGVLLREGNDLTIFCIGTMVSQSLQAAEILEEYGYKPRVVNMHTVKPIDQNMILKACEETRLIVTVEEHNIVGGLGSAVAEYKSTLLDTPPHLFLGIPDIYPKGAGYEELLNHFELTADQIARRILSQLESGGI